MTQPYQRNSSPFQHKRFTYPIKEINSRHNHCEIIQNFEFIMIAIIVIVATLSCYINSIYAHIVDSNKTQVWKNHQDNLKIEFGYLPEKPVIDTFTSLAFSVTNLQTGEHDGEGVAQVTVTNGQRLFKFENVSVQNGDFTVDYLFPDDGTHQVLLRLDRNDTIDLASFNVFVPHQSPPDLLSNNDNVIIGVGLISAVGIITILIIRKK